MAPTVVFSLDINRPDVGDILPFKVFQTADGKDILEGVYGIDGKLTIRYYSEETCVAIANLLGIPFRLAVNFQSTYTVAPGTGR
jgi:hypothetical protein